MANRKIDGIIPPFQTCNKCNENKLAEQFSERKYKGKSFLNKTCKKCVCDRTKEYKEKNREKVLESKRRYWMKTEIGYWKAITKKAANIIKIIRKKEGLQQGNGREEIKIK